MFILNFPVSVKFPNTNSFLTKYNIICDNALYNRIITEDISYTWQNVRIENPVKTVNDYLGVKLLSESMEFLTVTKRVEPELTPLSDLSDMLNFLGIRNRFEYVDDSVEITTAGYYTIDYVTALNSNDLPLINLAGVSRYSDGSISYARYGALSHRINEIYLSPYVTSPRVIFELNIYPENIITNGYNEQEYPHLTSEGAKITVEIRLHENLGSYDYANYISISSSHSHGSNSPMSRLYDDLVNFTTQGALIDIDDMENPYGEDGTSTTGGGDGTLPAGSEGLDFIDPTDIPDLPTLSGVATGFITMYNPTSSQLSSLGAFLWSGMFDLDTYKKLFADPMQGIIGLGIVPVLPSFAGTRNIMFGNVDTGVNCQYLASQYAKKDCGAVNIQKYVGSFMDYSPYVKISLFLPYIGFVNLGTDDIMGGSINVTYNVDVLTGDCIAFIKHNTKGVLYAYHGNCLTNVPVSGQNYANALKNYYESVAGVIPATTNGATGGVAGAIGGAIAGTLQSASNIILNSKPTFQRSGNIGGSAGIMGIQKPFVVIERPNISVPNNIQHYAGQTSNITMGLGSCSGLTIVDSVHLNGISATSQELKEIESLLKGGVIL